MFTRLISIAIILQIANTPSWGQTIPRQRVSSSLITSAGYDPRTHTLALEFRQGSLYHYLKVPEKVFEELMSAPSKGRYFHTRIKNRYRFIRIR